MYNNKNDILIYLKNIIHYINYYIILYMYYTQLDFFMLRHGCTARIHRPRLYVRPRASAAAESRAVELICVAARAEESRASTVRRRFLAVDPAGRKLLRGTVGPETEVRREGGSP